MEKTACGFSSSWSVVFELACVLFGVVMLGVFIAGGYDCSVRGMLIVGSVAISSVWNDQIVAIEEKMSGVRGSQRASPGFISCGSMSGFPPDVR